MANEQQSSPSKCILINPNTMGSLPLGPEQINLIVLALIGFTHEATGADVQLASDLADTLHKHVFDRPLLRTAGGGGGGGSFVLNNAVGAYTPGAGGGPITQQGRQYNDKTRLRGR